MSISRRIGNHLMALRILRRSGVALLSVLAFPLVRRLFRRAELRFRDGTRLSAPASEPLIPLVREVFHDAKYAPVGAAGLGDGSIVDIGANVGAFSVWAATRYPGRHIVSVEPSAGAVPWLRRNVGQNGRTVTVVHAAVGGTSRVATLYGRGEVVRNSLYDQDHYGSSFAAIGDVQVCTLDEIFREHGVQRCALLKLDCEGAEYEILRGASAATLACVGQIVGEYHVGLTPDGPHELRAVLEAAGFAVSVDELEDVESGYFRAWRADPE
jgi:FkbM family methyltransferase